MAKPHFHDPLDLRAVGAKKWKLLLSFKYTTLITGKPYRIDVPKGFVNDLASIPRIFQTIVPKIGKHRGAAVVHDYLYGKKGKLSNQTFTRKQCDQIFLEGMKTAGVRFTRRWVMYQAVRAGGWVLFNKEPK
jgi:hypothetical protein